jgi:hypothetical protein
VSTPARALRRTHAEAPEPGTLTFPAAASGLRRPAGPWSPLPGAILLALFGLPLAGVADEIPTPPPEQVAQYQAEGRKTIIELQQFRRSQSIVAESAGGRRGAATLVELNPLINAWFLLTLDWGDPAGPTSFHLENPDPDGRHLSLVDTQPHGLLITDHDAAITCDLWSGDPSSLGRARASSLPYAPLCDGRLYLRNPVAGRRTDLERVAELLRDHVWGGEALVGFVREEFFRDAYLERGTPGPAAGPVREVPGAPGPAALGEAYADRAVTTEHLGIEVLGQDSGRLTLGQWYPARDLPGIYVSVMQPQAVSTEILTSYPGLVNRLDGVEAAALDYLVAFDLAAFDLGFALGTEHPRVGWSPRPPEAVRSPGLPGPDGIETVAPLVTTGMVSPALVGRTAATFTGGFKREHGAFKYGDLAGRNRGSHNGFIEQGVVFSKLQPGLATIYVLDDGAVHMATWSVADDALLPRVRYVRQNGVPLVEPDATGEPAPGALVARWGPGNWSGSAAGELRALRAGSCLQQSANGRFLIYGWFSTATPSAMARVFQAYGCQYAMLLDMNALEHTYLAVYLRQGDEIAVQHLIRGMEEVDKSTDGQMIPRFIGFPDNRDFFYLVRRKDRP